MGTLAEESLRRIINKKLVIFFLIIAITVSIVVVVLVNRFIHNRIINSIYQSTVNSAFSSLEQYYKSVGILEGSFDRVIEEIMREIKEETNETGVDLKSLSNPMIEKYLEHVISNSYFDIIGIKREPLYYIVDPEGMIVKTNDLKKSGIDFSKTSPFWDKIKGMDKGDILIRRLAFNEKGIPIKYICLKLPDNYIFKLALLFNPDVLNNIAFRIKSLENRIPYLEEISLYNRNFVPVGGTFSELSNSEEIVFKELDEDREYIEKEVNRGKKVYYLSWQMAKESANYLGDVYFLKIKFDFTELVNLGLYSSLGIGLLILGILIFFIIYNLNLSQKITDPFIQLAESMNNISAVDLTEFDSKIDRTEIKEVNMLLASYQEMTSELSANFEELKAMNEELGEAYRESNILAEKLNKVIGVTGKLTDTFFENKEGFLKELFRVAKTLIDEADYGSVYLVEDEQWRYIDTIGHDLEKLQQIPLKKEYLPSADNVELIEDILTVENNQMPPEILDKVIAASKPIKSTLTVKLWMGSELSGGMSLDIAEDSKKSFSHQSVETLKAFGNLASAFLSMHGYNRIQDRFQREIIFSIINILEIHDKYTKGHSENVARISVLLAEEMGLNQDLTKQVYWAGLVHDIGKILIDKNILNKPGKLSEVEYKIIKNHPVWGYEVLQGSEELIDIADFVRHHHERWDGKGYPDRLVGEDIPLVSRIICVADAWDTMRSDRVYRKKLSRERAINELIKGKGSQFAPGIVEGALKLIEKGKLK